MIEYQHDKIQDFHLAIPNFFNVYKNLAMVLVNDEESDYNFNSRYNTDDTTHTNIWIRVDPKTTLIELFLIGQEHDDYTSDVIGAINVSYYDYIFSPLKQTQNGVKSQDVWCKTELQLVLRTDGPACVKPESISRLVEHGWIRAG